MDIMIVSFIFDFQIIFFKKFPLGLKIYYTAVTRKKMDYKNTGINKTKINLVYELMKNV